jgi:hypothetical protein
MAYYNSLRIWTNELHYQKIEEVLGIKPTEDELSSWWIHEIESDNKDYIEYFLSILDDKYEQLKQIGIERDAIGVWIIYDYDAECNMEFSSNDMYKLGKEEIVLCISCMDIHDYDADKKTLPLIHTKSYYSLQIDVPNDKFEIVNRILGVKSNKLPFWELQLIEKDEDEYIPFIDYFLAILESKYDQLEEIGVKRDDISIWLIYCYDGQCNMEFSPQEMYSLGKEGITFCVSCYDIHDYDADYDEV